MGGCDDFIQFDNSEDWERVIGITRTAQIFSDNSHVPIAPFDLGVSITEPYVVIVVQAIDGRTTWRYGGEVRQTWNFPSGSAIGSSLGKAQSQATPMGINKPQIIGLSRNTVDDFRLTYHPPSWFRGVVVIGWKYVGTVENFTKDTLFDIGNALGTGTIDEPTSIPNLLANQQTTLQSILDRLADLEDNLARPIANASLAQEDLQQINQLLTDNTSQVNQRIDSFSNDLSNVLAGNESANILANNNQQTNLIDEFI